MSAWIVCAGGVVSREALRYWNQRERFIASLVRPLVWLLIFAAGFRAILGVSIQEPTRPTYCTRSMWCPAFARWCSFSMVCSPRFPWCTTGKAAACARCSSARFPVGTCCWPSFWRARSSAFSRFMRSWRSLGCMACRRPRSAI